MKTNSPTHDAISRRAQELWNARGKPQGSDDAIWFEAERQLIQDPPVPPDNGSDETRASFDPFGQNRRTAKVGAESSESVTPDPLETAAKSAQLKRAASAPRLPTHKNAPPHAPAESGKPLWNQPHSS